ncbi:MAG: DAPG hydrolase family protein [Myxococcota bacterium]
MRNAYLGMRQGDLDGKPYARYWNPEMAPLPEPARQALARGAEAPELGFPVEEADRLLDPGHLPLETGFTRLANGQVFVAVLTRMPGVRHEMIDWWMGWHYQESQRYKLWHPRAHLANRAERMVGDDPGLSDREKYLHNPNYVSEYVGPQRLDIVITFSAASSVLDTARFEAAGVGTAVCGVVELQRPRIAIGRLLHLIRATDDGCEMRSRFWLGATPLGEGRLGRFVAGRAAPLSQGRDLLVHCADEMNHLAGFLPALYADYHPAA